MINKTHFKINFIYISMLALFLHGCAAPPMVSDKELIELYENVRLNPDSAAAYHNLGIAFYYKGQNQKAINALKESIRLRPDDPDTHYDMSLAYDEMKDGKNAITKMIDSEKLYREQNDQVGKIMAENQLNSYYSKYDYQPEDFGQTYPDLVSPPKSIIPNLPPQFSEEQVPGSVQGIYAGTGFMFSSRDYVITNWHVIRGMKSIKVKFLNGEKINAKVLLKDAENDIAFLKLEQSPQLPASEIRIGDSSKIRMGDEVFTIGYPAHWILGMNPKYTKGEVNALSGISDDPRVFQVSVQIQPGNSGGPLFNSKGEVIGITQASLDPKVAMGTFGTLPQNVNYAIKSSYISNLLPMLPETMIASRGIVVVPADPENNLANFIDKVKKNIVLIEAK